LALFKFLKKSNKNTEERIPKPPSEDEVSSAISSLYEKSQLRPYNPDELWQKKDWTVFDDMRQDDQVGSILRLKKYIILSANWQIEGENEKINEQLTENLKHELDESLNAKLYEILSSFDYGFSVTEKLWKKEGNLIKLKNLKTRAPHGFELHTDDKGDLKFLLQYQPQGQEPLDPDKFIVNTYQKEFDNWYGQSDMNMGVYRSWWSKEAIIKFWNIFLERFGMPLAEGVYPKGKKGYVEALRKILDNLQAKTTITHSDEVEIKFLEAMRTGTAGYEGAIDKHNMLIARGMLIPDLLGFGGGETSGGSFALGEKHFEIFHDIMNTLRDDLERTINLEIIKPLVLWNYGANERAWFKFFKVDPAKKEAQRKAWSELLKAKPDIGKVKEQINWFLESIDAPILDDEYFEEPEVDEEKERMREELAAIKAQQDNPDNPIPGNEEPDPEPGKEPEPEDTKKNVRVATDEGAFWRKLTKYEKKQDVKTINEKELILINEYMVRMESDYELIFNSLVSDIRNRKLVERKDFEAISNLKIKHSRELERTIKSMMTDGYNLGVSSIPQPTIKKLAIETASPFDDVTSAMKSWINVTSKGIVTTNTQEILQITQSTLTDAVNKGMGIGDTVKSMSKALNGYDLNMGGAVLERIARTEIHKAFSESRARQFEEVSGNIEAYQFSAILDGSTSDICRSLDKNGEGIYGKEALSEINPPVHPNCRSILIPIFKDEAAEEKNFSEKVKDIPGVDRVSTKGGTFLKLKK
jgi:SPP1 gp7 family putative phage head morphogenesis protein